jgi:hypothetical protein
MRALTMTDLRIRCELMALDARAQLRKRNWNGAMGAADGNTNVGGIDQTFKPLSNQMRRL